MKFSDFINSEKSHLSHYLLIGNPVMHSLSPTMHNLALKHNRIGGEYISVSVSSRDVNMVLAHCTNDSFLGANITIPHKELFFDAVDELTEEAKEIGAINTIIKQNGRLIGHNTDAYGFVKPIEKYIDELHGERVVIFGSGGATKAIIFALRNLGVEQIILVSRRPEMYKSDKALDIKRCSYDNWMAYAEDASMIVNATPLGMTPNTESSPIPDQDIAIMEDKICYDIVYNPRLTKFLKQATQSGGIPIGGLDMLIHQGARSFNLWTGFEFPIEKIKVKLDEILPA
ncbi:MAG: shikimate dehydrogenase [Balneola sp.]